MKTLLRFYLFGKVNQIFTRIKCRLKIMAIAWSYSFLFSFFFLACSILSASFIVSRVVQIETFLLPFCGYSLFCCRVSGKFVDEDVHFWRVFFIEVDMLYDCLQMVLPIFVFHFLKNGNCLTFLWVRCRVFALKKLDFITREIRNCRT